MSKVEGLDRLRSKLNRFPDALRDEIRKAMEQGAAEIVAIARSLAPVDSGTLRDSIGWTWGAPPGGSISLASAKAEGGDRLTVYAGSDDAFYARWVEFGTIKMAPRAFFYPGYRSVRRKVISRNTRTLRKVAKEIAQNGR